VPLDSRALTELAQQVSPLQIALATPDALEALPTLEQTLQHVEDLSALLGSTARALRENLPGEGATPAQVRPAWLAQRALVALAHATERATWITDFTAYISAFDLADSERAARQDDVIGLQYELGDELDQAMTHLRSGAKELAARPAASAPGRVPPAPGRPTEPGGTAPAPRR